MPALDKDITAEITKFVNQTKTWGTEKSREVTWDDLQLWNRDTPPSIVTFEPLELQKLWFSDIQTMTGLSYEELWKANGLRENILKPRQGYMTTGVIALLYLAWCNLPRANIITLAHHPTACDEIWQRIRFFHKNTPEEKRPPLHRNTLKMLERSDNGSTFLIGTQGETDISRSRALTHLHVTETSSWGSKGVDQFVAALGTLDANGCLLEETTAKGPGQHHTRYISALSGKGSMIARFYPWYAVERYRAVPVRKDMWEEADFARLDTLPIDEEQNEWYRLKKIDYELTDHVELVAQEFPATVEEAFIATSTGAVFPVDYLMRRRENLPQSIAKYKPNPIDFFFGNCLVYEEFDTDYQYVIGVDCSSGLKDGRRDFSSAQVGCVETFSQVASYWSQGDPDELSNDLIWLSMQYNNAKIRIERNGPGIPLIARLQEKGFDNLYAHPAAPSRLTGTTDDRTQFGYPSTAHTKKLMISQLGVSLVRAKRGEDSGSLLVNDRDTLDELLHYSYVKKEEGFTDKMAGQAGSHDDKVIALALMVMEINDHVPRWTSTYKQPESIGSYGGSYNKRGRTEGWT